MAAQVDLKPKTQTEDLFTQSDWFDKLSLGFGMYCLMLGLKGKQVNISKESEILHIVLIKSKNAIIRDFSFVLQN